MTPKAGQAPPIPVPWPRSHAQPARGGVKKLEKLVIEVKRPMCFGDPRVNCPIWVCDPIQPMVCKSVPVSDPYFCVRPGGPSYNPCS